MTAVRPARLNRQSPLGAKVSATLQRWPSRNYFAEIPPVTASGVHPIDRMLEREPHLRNVGRRAARLFAKIQRQAKLADLLEFEAEHTLLDTARVEVAFNLGFENGLVVGRADGLRRRARRRRDAKEKALQADLLASLVATRATPRRTALLLLEMAWAFAVGSGREDESGVAGEAASLVAKPSSS